MFAGIVLGVIGAIVAVGLALLFMWKVLTTIHDRREYARFEKERMMARWDTVSTHPHTEAEITLFTINNPVPSDFQHEFQSAVSNFTVYVCFDSAVPRIRCLFMLDYW